MAQINDKELNQLNREKVILTKALDASPKDEDLKKQLKNLNERIRYRQKKLIAVPTVEIKEQPVLASKKFGKVSMKATVEAELKAGNSDASRIASKYGFKIESVRWYVSKLSN